MNLKALFHRLFERLCNYNIYVLATNEHPDDDEPKDPATVLRHQRYATWLYIVLLIGKYGAPFLFLKLILIRNALDLLEAKIQNFSIYLSKVFGENFAGTS